MNNIIEREILNEKIRENLKKFSQNLKLYDELGKEIELGKSVNYRVSSTNE
jgi:hypothetical protein